MPPRDACLSQISTCKGAARGRGRRRAGGGCEAVAAGAVQGRRRRGRGEGAGGRAHVGGDGEQLVHHPDHGVGGGGDEGLALEAGPRDAHPGDAREQEPREARRGPLARGERGEVAGELADDRGGEERERVGVEHGRPDRGEPEPGDEVLGVGQLEHEQHEPDEDPRVRRPAARLELAVDGDVAARGGAGRVCVDGGRGGTARCAGAGGEMREGRGRRGLSRGPVARLTRRRRRRAAASRRWSAPRAAPGRRRGTRGRRRPAARSSGRR